MSIVNKGHFVNCQVLTPKDVSVVMGTLLKDHLGTYKYDDGKERVAISIGKPTKHLTVTGLELIVPKMPNVRDSNEYWSLYLIDRSDTDGNDLYMAYRTLKEKLALFTKIIYLPSVEEFDNYDQIAMTLHLGQINHIAYQLNLIDKQNISMN
jgi:hypothetical protein